MLKNPFFLYILKFAGIFCVCYYGTIAMIGLAAPGGYHVPFIEKYLDYVHWIKLSLMYGPALILSLFGINTHMDPGYLIHFAPGEGVVIAMDCVGYGVYSFWIAFIAANTGTWMRKAKWILFGLLGLWFINVLRVTLLLTAINKNWPMPLGLDHHDWFNIFAYLLIFTMIWWYDKTGKSHLANG